MKVTIPNIALPEVQYTFHCLLKVFLGLDYELEVDANAKDFVIVVGQKKLIIKNCFFKNDTPNQWYSNQNIPTDVSKENLKIGGDKLPIISIFGKSELHEVGEELILESDILASTFFMLSRWEEYANPKRDAHHRFSSKESLAYKYDFLQKPIVNQYVEILWALLQKLEIQQKRKERHFEIVPTHDVDIPFLFTSPFQSLKTLARHLVDPGFFRDGIHFTKSYLQGNDPNDTHDIFLDGAEKLDAKAHFFFITGGKNKYDPSSQLNHPKVKSLIEKIKKRGHYLGFHPSYNAYQDSDLFNEEKTHLENTIGQEVKTGRQHYLRFEVPTTWNLWENASMEWDSTLGYADAIGFRCGVCYPFPVFDILQRKQLQLYERPLLFMETTLGMYDKLSLADAQMKVNTLIDEVKQYRGEFVFLWHNSSLNLRIFAQHNAVLFDIYKMKIPEKI